MFAGGAISAVVLASHVRAELREGPHDGIRLMALVLGILFGVLVLRAISGKGVTRGLLSILRITLAGMGIFAIEAATMLAAWHFHEAHMTIVDEDSTRFREALAIAVSVSSRTVGEDTPSGVGVTISDRYSAKSSGATVKYPPHSLVVYAPKDGAEVDWSKQELRKYHYECPREWLATTKQDVKVVALVTTGKREIIGHYEPGSDLAYKTTWDVTFVDLAAERVVAVAHVTSLIRIRSLIHLRATV